MTLELPISVVLLTNQIKKQMKEVVSSVSKIKTTKGSLFPDLEENSKAFKNIQTQAKRLLGIQDSLGTQNVIYKDQARLVNNLGKQMKLTTDQVKQLTKAQKGFNFNFLTFIFTGILLERVFGGALKSILNSYKEIAGVNSAFNRSVLKLSASWNFLKFSIADALNNPAVVNGVEFIIDSFEILADFISENEQLALSLLAILAGGFVIGKLVSLTGALLQLGILLALITAEAQLLKTNLNLLKTIGIITVVLAVGFVLAKSVQEFINSSNTGKEAWESFMDSLSQLGKDILEPLGEFFGQVGFDMENFSDVMVFVGSVTVSTLAAMTNSISLLTAVWRTAWNIIEASVSIGIFSITKPIELLIDSLSLVAKAANFFGADFDTSGLDKLGADFERANDKLLESGVIDNIKDVGDAWKNFGNFAIENQDSFTNPFKAVTDAQTARAIQDLDEVTISAAASIDTLNTSAKEIDTTLESNNERIDETIGFYDRYIEKVDEATEANERFNRSQPSGNGVDSLTSFVSSTRG